MRQDFGCRRSQPPFRAVADNRTTDPSARGEADPQDRSLRAALGPRCCLQNQARHHGLATAGGDAEKITPALESFQYRRQKFDGVAEASSGEPLAALGPTRREDPATGRGRHSRPKTMAALANDLAGLVSAFHC